MKLQGKVALVTGADSGIGQAIAITFAREGANVVINYKNDEQGANSTGQQVEAEGRKALVVQADLRDPQAVRSMFERARSELGAIDVLVNNAGLGVEGSLTELSLEDWDTVLNTNLRAAFLCAQEAARDMLQKGGGKIVNISSVAGKQPGGVYSISKAGMDMLTKALAQELTPQGINVNGISPGLVYTPMTAERVEDPKQRQQQEEQIPVGRVGEPMDIASMALFLVAEAGYMSGSDVVIDGGSSVSQG
ncbi:MAG: 3-oxoacyl-ACP reductase FabG [Chloroflexota bacterium]|nr:3-oxoacyl-ACP reductase FabG [Chloroflexota bacterium]